MRASLSGHVPEHFCRGVRRFPTAHNMVAKLGRAPVFRRYWDYPASIDRGVSFEEACERFRALLVDAVRLRMRSDVAVGTTLSSGMDSSSLVCLLRTFYEGEQRSAIWIMRVSSLSTNMGVSMMQSTLVQRVPSAWKERIIRVCFRDTVSLLSWTSNP